MTLLMQVEAMVLRTHGGPEVLRRETIELPEPGPREVRVRVRAVALNHLDIWTRRGLPHVKHDYPHRLGADIAGTIDALGPGAHLSGGLKVGDKVLVNPGVSCGVCAQCLAGRDNLCKSYKILGEHAQGGYARFHNVPDTNLLPFPEPLSFTDAAAIPLVFLTAWQMLVHKAKVRPGETVLVQAAGSGVSSAAIQIAKLFGARVIATTGSEDKKTRARELGADHVINYATEDMVAECKKLTGKRGVDSVIEHVGGDVFLKSVMATAWGGRVVTCGATAGFTPTIDLRQIFFRQVEVLGSTMGSKADLFAVLTHVASGKLRPVVDRVLPLWEAAEAHRVIEAREAFGKVVLEVD
jgi:NADPH:quinone reductase-like Zn-dependent oxidoreductase